LSCYLSDRSRHWSLRTARRSLLCIPRKPTEQKTETGETCSDLILVVLRLVASVPDDDGTANTSITPDGKFIVYPLGDCLQHNIFVAFSIGRIVFLSELLENGG
ncbi:6584_t:CDS:1, partial [Ambispora leptoticha]